MDFWHRTKHCLFVFFSISVAIAILGTKSYGEDAIKITYGNMYKPFAWGKGEVARGIQVDFVNAILVDKLQLNVKHLPCPWRRCQSEVKNGIMDGFFTVPTIERSQYTIENKIPFYETQFLMHTSRTNPKVDRLKTVKSLKDLENMPDITHVYMFGSGWHEQALKNMKNVIVVKDAFLIPKLLALHRADLYIEQEEMIRYQARALGLSDEILTIRQPVIRNLGWHIFISKNSEYTRIIPEIDAILEDLKQSGELERIKMKLFEKYGVSQNCQKTTPQK